MYDRRKHREFGFAFFGYSAQEKHISTTAMIAEVDRLQKILESNASVPESTWVPDKAAQEGTLKNSYDKLVGLRQECKNLAFLQKNIDCEEYLEKTNIPLITG